MRTSLTAALLIVAAAASAAPSWARVSQSDIAQCADSPKAEAAVAACTRLYEDGGLDARNKAIALGNRGAALRLMGRYDDAISDFAAAIGLDPRNPQYYCQRADLYLKKQEFDDAVADYSTALEKSPNYVWAYRGRGQAYLGKSNATLALSDFNAALRAKPDDLNLLLLRGRANSQGQNYDEAVADFTRVLDGKMKGSLLPSERAVVLSQRAFARLKQDRTSEGKVDVDEALRIAPKNAFALAVSGLLEEQLGHKSEAISRYERALAIDSDLQFARRGLDRLKQTEAAVTPPPKPLAPAPEKEEEREKEEPAPAAKPAEPEPEVEKPTPAVAKPSPPKSTGKTTGDELCARFVPAAGKTVLVPCDD